MKAPRPNAWKELDLAAVGRNLRHVRRRLAPGTQVMAVVKTNAYGHGMVPVARKAWECGVRWFGVSNTVEGAALRAALPARARILILECCQPDHIQALVSARLTPVVCDAKFAALLDGALKKAGKKMPYHVAVDTGMGRIGVRPEKLEEFAAKLGALKNAVPEGLFSHFACADDPKNPFNARQLEKFRAAEKILARGLPGALKVRHLANSASALSRPEAHFDLVRLGISLYGLSPFASDTDPRARGLRPVLSVRTRVTFVKDVPAGTPISYGCRFAAAAPTRIATLSIGYGHGLSRLLTNRGRVIVRGKIFPVVGTVTMSQIMIDLGRDRTVRPGDTATIIGAQGRKQIGARELAALQGTISYEVCCAFSGLRLLP